MRQVALEYAGRQRWVREWAKTANEQRIDRMSLETRGYETTKRALGCLPKCVGVPCWDLEALVLRTKDAEDVVEISESDCAKDERNLA